MSVLRNGVASVACSLLLGCSLNCPPGTEETDEGCQILADAGEVSADAEPECESPRTFYADADLDGYGDNSTATLLCEHRPGMTQFPDDCDDSAPTVNPSAEEICNGVDDDCLGGADDGFECVEGDAFSCEMACGLPGTTTCSGCVWSACTAPEVCNYADDDCDGLVDPELQALLGEPTEIGRSSTGALSIAWTGQEYALAYGRNGVGYQLSWIDPGTKEVLESSVLSDSYYLSAIDLEVGESSLFSAACHDGSVLAVEIDLLTRDPVTSALDSKIGWKVECQVDLTGTGQGAIAVMDGRSIDEGTDTLLAQHWVGGQTPDAPFEIVRGYVPSFDAVADDGGVLVGWIGDGSGMQLARMDEEGQFVEPSRGIPGAEAATSVVLSRDAGGSFLALFNQYEDNEEQVRAVPIDQNLDAGDVVVVAELDAFLGGGVASSGWDHLVVVVRRVRSVPAILRLAASGEVTGAPIEIADDVSFARVVWTGDRYGVVYETEDGRIFLREYGCE